jgi:hypothetical protein
MNLEMVFMIHAIHSLEVYEQVFGRTQQCFRLFSVVV